jgi:hypothetical protein
MRSPPPDLVPAIVVNMVAVVFWIHNEYEFAVYLFLFALLLAIISFLAPGD